MHSDVTGMRDRTSAAIKSLILSSVTRTAAIGAFAFVALYTSIPTQHLVILLNSIIVGSLVAVSVAYARLALDAVIGEGEYDRVRQMTLGFILGWVAIFCFIANSITIRAFDPGVAPNTMLNALGRFIAIWAAVLQVTAPDFGQKLMYGRDRRFLWGGVATGLVVAVLLIMLQSGDIAAGR